MASRPPRFRPGVEQFDARVVMSAAAVAPPTHLIPHQYPGADAHRPFTPADLRAYATVYQSFLGAPDFTPQYDFNGTGFIGQNDATPILRGLAGITPRIPLQLQLRLAPGEQVSGHHPSDNGGVTRSGTVTVVGKTTPNSIVFLDGPGTSPHAGPTGNFQFRGGAIATDGQGNFRYTLALAAESHSGSLTGTAYLIRTPFGQQLIRSFPILRIR